jgi:hypothetical protein
MEERDVTLQDLQKKSRKHPGQVRLPGFVQRRLNTVIQLATRRRQGRNFIHVWNSGRAEPVGIYLFGGCDMMSVFAAEPLLRAGLKGHLSIFKGGTGAASARSDIMLQSRQPLPSEQVQETVDRLQLPRNYFQPGIFDPYFELPGRLKPNRFKKNVVILSIAPDIVRTAYRHREHGFLVDPGGWWLNQSMENVLQNMETVTWFSRNFEKIGKISPEDSMRNFEALIGYFKDTLGARVILYNSLSVEPGDQTYNYQLVRNSQTIRRRKFNLGLVELSRRLNFSIIDIDRILKQEGVREQVDFAHWPIERFETIAAEVVRILKENEVL